MNSNYFSGFCLNNEQELFSAYRIENDFTVSGFSYGAIKAFEYALNTNKRVDLLQLFSPAFFQDREKKYKRLQLMFFKKDAQSYCQEFLSNISHPSSVNTTPYFTSGSYEELDELLHYEWSGEQLEKLLNRGTKIEVYLAAEDKIIDAPNAKAFFINYATVYYIKNKGHIL